jgi:hypothetical protein
MENLSSKFFKTKFVGTFPGDDSGNTRARQTPGVLYSKELPTPVQKWKAELKLTPLRAVFIGHSFYFYQPLMTYFQPS